MSEVKTGLATDHQVAEHIKSSRAQVWVLARNNPKFPKPLRTNRSNPRGEETPTDGRRGGYLRTRGGDDSI